jgi:hypothetical protein
MIVELNIIGFIKKEKETLNQNNMDFFKRIGQEKLNKLSTVTDPFSKDCIKDITVYYKEKMFDKGVWYARGSVEFRKGSTTGRQEFDGETFDEVVLKIKNFIENEL